MTKTDSVPPPPSQADVKLHVELMEPLRKLIDPKVYGIENVPERRALLVGNHTIYGVLDLPLMWAELADRGRILRMLGDHAFYKIEEPEWRKVLSSWGVVEGTPANCAALMRRRELIMVFPGGGREVRKHKGQRYKLLWNNRMGFARLAIEHGYPIVPFASVGPEEALDIVADADDPLLAPMQQIFEKAFGSPDYVPPIVRGVGLTQIPRPERQYYWFGEPIHTTAVKGRQTDEAVVEGVRDATKAAVEKGIGFLLVERINDPNRSVIKRLVGPEQR